MRHPRIKTGITMATALVVSALAINQAHAESFPARTITIVVPFPAGGTPDILARIMGEKASAQLKQTIVVENKAGAGGSIGIQATARSKNDGYTLVMCAYGCAVAPSLYKPAPYNIETQFAPVVMVGTVPSVLVTNPKNVPAKTVQEFVSYARDNPGKINAASSGIGGSAHIGIEMIKREADIDIAHIPYKGAGQVAGDLLGGQIDMYFDNLPASLASIQNGRLNAIAVASSQRSAAIPDVPTFAESGYPDMLITPWFGLLAPAGTPEQNISKLNAAFNAAFKDPEVQKKFTDLGVNIAGGSSQALAEFIKSETAKIATLIEENNITAN
ncbi:ABC transporter substrate-binding protein [Advenella sp. S44]|uniref:Bug family tripartite tricarboxylate transporter substrate binding protein n=1 Tax=Advenella sp. S44 TaxID=1982755 RepID=UPI000C2B05E5|nr:tripartite tricarboxylate transporter substrate binding protein [Advenella sp. S44]PJX20949.1 ABC transporter substrate-binding protein [Advenella sp. S44]